MNHVLLAFQITYVEHYFTFYRSHKECYFSFIYFSGRVEYAPMTITCLMAEVYLTLYKSLIRLDANLKLFVVSKRISHYSVVVGGMLLFWLWEAQLINYFTFPLNKLPFQNLEEFLSDSDKKVNRKHVKSRKSKSIKNINLPRHDQNMILFYNLS